MSKQIQLCESLLTHPEVTEQIKKSLPSYDEFNELANLYKVFSDPTRIKIIYLLFSSEMCVCDITAILGMTQSAISHQLAILKAHHLVSYKKVGKEVIYRLQDDHVKKIFDQGYNHTHEEKTNE